MNFEQAARFLDSLQMFKIKLGLSAMEALLADLGRPHERLCFLHIAGTNGKGSVAAAASSVLEAAGRKVGVYTSPHLSSVRERFRINKRYIPEAAFARHASEIISVLGGRKITYFEFTTTLALLWFAAEGVDLAVLEVGMGGRLDATNVVTPLVSVITNVALDHQQYLGDTLAQVAFEKAGIIKPGVPVVSGVITPEAQQVVDERARDLDAPLFTLDRDFSLVKKDDGWAFEGVCGPVEGIRFPLAGVHQQANMAVALAALEQLPERFGVTGEAVRQGLARVRWPGRMEFLKRASLSGSGNTARQVLLDGAHNPAGVESLATTLASGYPHHHLVLVWASMADKELAPSLERIAPLAQWIVFTRPAGERSADPEDLVLALPQAYRARAEVTRTVVEGLQRAWELASPADLICVAGSLYLVGEARKLLLGEVVDGA